MRVVLKGHSDAVMFLAYSPDGKALASCDTGGIVKVWDLHNRKEQYSLQGRDRSRVWLVGLAFNPQGNLLAAAGTDGTVKLWDLASKMRIATLRGADPNEAVRTVAFSPDGRTLAAGGTNRIITLLEVATQRQRISFRGARGWILALVFSNDGTTVISSGGDYTRNHFGEILVWKLCPTKGKKP
jgi:WD40 repeat protein